MYPVKNLYNDFIILEVFILSNLLIKNEKTGWKMPQISNNKIPLNDLIFWRQRWRRWWRYIRKHCFSMELGSMGLNCQRRFWTSKSTKQHVNISDLIFHIKEWSLMLYFFTALLFSLVNELYNRESTMISAILNYWKGHLRGEPWLAGYIEYVPGHLTNQNASILLAV